MKTLLETEWDINEKRHNTPLENISQTEKASNLLYINCILSKYINECTIVQI